MIKDLKDLKHLLSLCRKQGVTEISIGEIKITFGTMPTKSNEHEEKDDGDVELTDEQLMFYAVEGAK